MPEPIFDELRIGVSANARAHIDRAIIHVVRHSQPADLAAVEQAYGAGTTPATHAWVQAHRAHTRLALDPLIEAVPPAVRVGTFREKAGQTCRVYRVPDLAPALVMRAWAAARADLGRPYNYPAVIATCILLETHLPDIWQRLEGARLDCSQTATEILRGVGRDACPGVRSANVIPSGLERWLIAAGYPRIA